MAKQVIKTTRGDRIANVVKPKQWDPDGFYVRHRGGSGNVVVVFAHTRKDSRVAVFGSIERAQEWAFELGDKWSCAFVPYIVDEPDYGNAPSN